VLIFGVWLLGIISRVLSQGKGEGMSMELRNTWIPDQNEERDISYTVQPGRPLIEDHVNGSLFQLLSVDSLSMLLEFISGM
jgi:hypothetical protein